MVKVLHIKVDDDVYFKLIELKGKLKARDWAELIEKVLKVVDTKDR